MAFITVEDLVGTVEVVIFPRDYEKNQRCIWMRTVRYSSSGSVSEEDDAPSKLICESVIPFASDAGRNCGYSMRTKRHIFRHGNTCCYEMFESHRKERMKLSSTARMKKQ
ncbi:MAG: hypothetical protein ACLU80_06900 [Dorea sp.]